MSRRDDVENVFMAVLLVSSASAVAAWIGGMLRRRPFGALPAALWVVLVVTSLLCAAVVAVFEATR
jgi:hypothetical protein